MDLILATDDPRSDDVRELLAAHLRLMRAASPPEDVHALDGDALLAPEISFFSGREFGVLLVVGALKHLDPTHAELKSMHASASFRGRGLGRLMLAFLVSVAKERGYARVSLETGTMVEFEPARRLYTSAGFIACGPFGDYPDSPNSICMTLNLPH
jgi:putative acetyltransferase